ncbi:glycosyltransferase family 4 protein [Faecalicatena contorta]|uniref:glycosyltransferase family 4 protein n=1 Tax=Faecalicatena contorta TaxID=39482 RepID=UPI001F43EDE5|nr:glycosyltransferase family 4 protein [Faecalicatena contorta]MCF2681337.1 glycosyltransferase family 4 protein [Faecalicatena contorta]
MRILSVTAQKPNSTGSGVYLTELVKEYAKEGHVQAVVAGVYEEDAVELPDGVEFHPVYFCSEELPFPIAGMSDEMPYPSTRYCDMTPDMTAQFKKAFLSVLEPLIKAFQPDVILCHHLYLLTAVVREHFPECKIYGFCHNTDLRQMRKTRLEREYIREQVRKLDRIFVPQRAQEEGVKDIFHVDDRMITRLGMGYNSQIFHVSGEKPKDGITRIVFAGKIAEKKGVKSLIRSLSYLREERNSLQIFLAGSTGNEEEYEEIQTLARNCPYEVRFLGRLSQPELSKIYNACDIFTLPSFFEGIPLTVIEALACGCRVVMTDLPGIGEWLADTVPGADVQYVTLPQLRNTDEPVEEELPEFEHRLAEALAFSIHQKETRKADVSKISWKGISANVLKGGNGRKQVDNHCTHLL